MQLDSLLRHVSSEARVPPLAQWHPPCLGEMALLITRDGGWLHEGAPFINVHVLRLLSTLLRREEDGAHYLVAPREKWRISVEDTAFLIVDADQANGHWTLTTNLGDEIVLDNAARLRIGQNESAPTVPVRFGLEARLNRNVFYRLVEQAEQRLIAGAIELGIVSAGVWQPLGRIPAESA